MVTKCSPVRGISRYWSVAATWLMVAAMAASGCAPESSLDDVACQSDDDCLERGTSCHDGYCVVDDEGNARLTVAVDGLPAGVDADIAITDGADFEEVVSSTAILDDLWAGDYQITAGPVEDGDTTFVPAVADETIEIEAGERAEFTVGYGAASGAVSIETTGHGDDVQPTVELVDATGDTVGQIQSAGTIDDLLPGTYTVRGEPVTDDNDVIWQQTEAITVDVASETTADVTVPYSAQSGLLIVSIDGLDDDLTPNVQISADTGFDETIDTTGTTVFEDMEPGTYSIDAQPVDDDLATWQVTNVDEPVRVTSGAASEIGVEYALEPGGLFVGADTPAGSQQLRAKVDGPDGFTTTIDGEQLLEGLTPGYYDVTFLEVEEDGRRYEPAPATISQIPVESGDDPAQAHTDYTTASGSLAVAANGLASGVSAHATIEGPDGANYSFPDDESDLQDLSPGDYTVDFQSVDDGAHIYEPTADSVGISVAVNSDEETTVTGDYELVGGTLQLEVASGSAVNWLEAHITTPDGATLFESGDSATLTDLPPGDYTVEFQPFDQNGQYYSPELSNASGSSITVSIPSFTSAGDEVIVQVDYSAVDPEDGAIQVEATGLDDADTAGLRAEIHDTDGHVADVPTGGGETLIDELPPGDYTVYFQDTDETIDGITYNFSPSPDELDVTVSGGATHTATTHYTLDPASLTLETAESSSHLPVAATVIPPEGPSQYLEDDSPIELNNLQPGNYQVIFEDVEDDDGILYNPDGVPDGEYALSSNSHEQLEVDYVEADGAIEVSTTGLEDVTDPGQVATIEDDAGNEVEQIQGHQVTVDGLANGEYTVVFETVHIDDDVEFIYAPAGADDTYDVDVTVSGGGTATATVDYTLEPASLTLQLEDGLDGLPFEADIETPSGLIQRVEVTDEIKTIENLEPGSYQVEFLDVEDGGVIHTPAGDAGGDISLSSRTDSSMSVTYEVVDGTIEVTSDGLDDPDQLQASILLGDGSEHEVATDKEQLDVPPGDYTVEYAPVETADGSIKLLYEPVPAQRQITVESDAVAIATTEYVLQPGQLTVVVDIPDADDVPVDNADDYQIELSVDGLGETITADGPLVETFTDVDPGDYQITKVDGAEDRWGNELIFEGLDQTIEVHSGDEPEEHLVVAAAPTQVQTEADITTADWDDIADRSLRVVLEEVNDGSEISFADGVELIELTEGELMIDRPLNIFGDGVVIDGFNNNSERILSIDVTGADEVLLEAVTFTGADTADDGAALHVTGADDALVTLFDAAFTDNETDGDAGAVYAADGAELVVHTTTFSDNTAGDDGGAMSIADGASVSIERSLFSGNNATDGGAIYVTGELTVENSTYSANVASADGGALFFDENSTATMLHATMVQNDAVTGGAIRNAGSQNIELKSSYLNDNTDSADYDLDADTDTGPTRPVVSEGYNFIDAVHDDDFDDQPSDITDEPSNYDATLTDDGVHPLNDGTDNPGYQDIPADQCLDFEGMSVLIDQRGADRPYQGMCSRGAWEEDGN